jgi:transcriptional regulator GlxA family with amidase domain
MKTREIVADADLRGQLKLDPQKQLIGAQCSGTLILAKLGLLYQIPACTDLITKDWAKEAGVDVLDQPFFAKGNIATAGGCLASPYLSAWVIARLLSVADAESALHYVAPVGEKEKFVSNAMSHILRYSSVQ